MWMGWIMTSRGKGSRICCKFVEDLSKYHGWRAELPLSADPNTAPPSIIDLTRIRNSADFESKHRSFSATVVKHFAFLWQICPWKEL